MHMGKIEASCLSLKPTQSGIRLRRAHINKADIRGCRCLERPEFRFAALAVVRFLPVADSRRPGPDIGTRKLLTPKQPLKNQFFALFDVSIFIAFVASEIQCSTPYSRHLTLQLWGIGPSNTVSVSESCRWILWR